MPYECIETATEVQFYGNAFVDDVSTHKPVIVDGDLIASHILAPSVRLKNGSLVCPHIESPHLEIEILGVHDLSRPVADRVGLTYTWLRPVIEPLDPTHWTGTETIASVAAMFEHPAIIGDATKAKPFIARALARPSCGRARVLFDAALDELASELYLLTPLGQQVISLFILNEDLPRHWRF
jgi:hypothetical protein